MNDLKVLQQCYMVKADYRELYDFWYAMEDCLHDYE